MLSAKRRFTAPPTAGTTIAWLLAAVVLAVGAVAVVRLWAGRRESPERVLADASIVLRAAGHPLPDYGRALDVAWARALEVGAAPSRPLDLLLPDLPPALCPADQSSALATAILAVDAAIANTVSTELLAAVERLSATPVANGEDAFYKYYNLALATFATDVAGSDRWLRMSSAWLSTAIPRATAEQARREVLVGRFREYTAIAALAGRVLAGSVAMRVGDNEGAVSHFKYAVGASNYLPASDTGTQTGRYRRVEVKGRAPLCGSRAERGVSSLDAFTGLIAAYLADTSFRDRPGLRTETTRADGDVAATDPLGPVVRYAQRVARRRARSDIPEHFLWAASNTQGYYHAHRDHTDPRLEVARAVILLDLVDHDDWMSSLPSRADRCSTLHRLGQDLAVAERWRRARRVEDAPMHPPFGADSAMATLAINVQARLSSCSQEGTVAIADSVRTIWMATAGTRLNAPLVASAEMVRRAARSSQSVDLASSTGLDANRTRAALRRLDDSWRMLSVASWFGTGARDRQFRSAWRRAFFGELAESLHVAQIKHTGASAELDAQILRALRGAAYAAGQSPSDVYDVSEIQMVLREQPLGVRLAHWIYFDSVRPWVATLAVVLAVGLGLGTVYAGFVLWYRYHLFVRARFYAREVASSGA